MSALVAIHRPDGRVERREIARALGRMRRSVRERDAIWCDGAVGLGVLVRGDEALSIAHHTFPSGATVAVALAGSLDRGADAAVALAVYLDRDGEGLAGLTGEFAIAVWDGRRRRLVAARDALGSRTLYHRSSPRQVAVASESRALAALSGPLTRNDDRIADYLVPPLEAVDLTSTFHREIERLPAGHRLVEREGRISIERYWSASAVPDLPETADDVEWVERFRDAFDRAVSRRIGGAAGAMLSGGVDSSAIVGFGVEARRRDGAQPLAVLSVVGEGGPCAETRAIEAVLARPGSSPILIDGREIDALLPDLDAILDRLDEPFDATMLVPMLVYAAARRAGLDAVLDGVDGDAVLSLEPGVLGLVLRREGARAAWSEARELARFYDGSCPPWASRRRLLAMAARAAWAPPAARRAFRRMRYPRRVDARLGETILTRDPACRARVAERLAQVWNDHDSRPRNLREYHAAQIDHPFLAVAVERYDRVARAAAIEARHPFLDRQLVELALSAPRRALLRDGWTKWIVREASSGLVPDSVRWRRGRFERLGPSVLQGIIRRREREIDDLLREGRDELAPYVDLERLDEARRKFGATRDAEAGERLWSAARLAAWLRGQQAREEEDRAMTDEQVGSDDGKKKPYRTPALTEYGALKDLTAGGSGNANEGSMGQRPRP